MKKETTQKNTNGFTLLETLVAITILTFAIVATFTASQSGLSSAIESKNQVIGYYLAQEAVEYIRNMRDTNSLLNTSPTTPTNWLKGIAQSGDPCFPGNTCAVDVVASLGNQLTLCSGTCPNLVQDPTTGQPTSGMYGISSQHPTWSATNFNRQVQIQIINTDEAAVTVSITWTKGTYSQTFKIRESILNWQS